VSCLNNISIYKSKKLQEIYNSINVILTFLSLYFCDFNFIEIFFAILKRYIKYYKQCAKNYKIFKKFLQKIILTQKQRHNSNKFFKALKINYSYCNNIFN